MRRALLTIVGTLGLCVGAAGLGLAVNAVRGDGLPLVAPFPYVQDCPEKIDLSGPTIDAGKAVKLLDSDTVAFVDARPDEAFQRSHVPGARSLPFSYITPVSAAAAAPLKRFDHVIVYCDSQGEQLSRLLVKRLQELGLRQVKILEGGFAAFRAARAREGR